MEYKTFFIVGLIPEFDWVCSSDEGILASRENAHGSPRRRAHGPLRTATTEDEAGRKKPLVWSKPNRTQGLVPKRHLWISQEAARPYPIR